MEGTVEIRAGVGDHFNLADVKLGSRGVQRSRCFTGQMIGDNRRRQSFVGDHAVLDGVAEVY